MSEPDDTIIAGSKTCRDWRVFRNQLQPGGEAAFWEEAFENYFRSRIRLRYLDPIQRLQELNMKQGEGFSIVAIHCTLIEFLESTLQGISYHFTQRDEDLGPFEYRSSSRVFKEFLCKRQPFARTFARTSDSALAEDFYANVRCGVLHEARTKNGWKIRADGPPGTIVDPMLRLVFHKNFQAALLEFVEWYKSALASDRPLQEAFLRKFNSLCE